MADSEPLGRGKRCDGVIGHCGTQSKNVYILSFNNIHIQYFGRNISLQVKPCYLILIVRVVPQFNRSN